MLYGDHIRLRAIERDDLPTFVRWFNDPEVRRDLLLTEPMSHAAEERWFDRLLETEEPRRRLTAGLAKRGECATVSRTCCITARQRLDAGSSW